MIRKFLRRHLRHRLLCAYCHRVIWEGWIWQNAPPHPPCDEEKIWMDEKGQWHVEFLTEGAKERMLGDALR
jgi:hypothetical protein